jgi:hypothetical protein
VHQGARARFDLRSLGFSNAPEQWESVSTDLGFDGAPGSKGKADLPKLAFSNAPVEQKAVSTDLKLAVHQGARARQTSGI